MREFSLQAMTENSQLGNLHTVGIKNPPCKTSGEVLTGLAQGQVFPVVLRSLCSCEAAVFVEFCFLKVQSNI